MSIQKDNIRIQIQAYDKGWKMGNDLNLCVSPEISWEELGSIIRKHKQCIHPSRMTFILPPARPIAKEQWKMCLRQSGVYDESMITLEPTLSGVWLWHPIDYYRKEFLDGIIKLVKARSAPVEIYGGGVPVKSIRKYVALPPPLRREDYLPFIRQYPEIFLVEVNTVTKKTIVRMNTNLELPVWFER
mmetsp:Transcript_49856/g.59973  ORF Transcript_49856/g.59973 Transcript_49856/m.59973 type:complete len:187 (+) Transcript_49856:192-752(+)